MNLSDDLGRWVGDCCGCTRFIAIPGIRISHDCISQLRENIREAVETAKLCNYVIVLTATDSERYSKFEEALSLEGFETLEKSGSKTIWYKPTIGSSL